MKHSIERPQMSRDRFALVVGLVVFVAFFVPMAGFVIFQANRADSYRKLWLDEVRRSTERDIARSRMSNIGDISSVGTGLTIDAGLDTGSSAKTLEVLREGSLGSSAPIIPKFSDGGYATLAITTALPPPDCPAKVTDAKGNVIGTYLAHRDSRGTCDLARTLSVYGFEPVGSKL